MLNHDSTDEKPTNQQSWLKKAGLAGMVFFTLKGLAWTAALVWGLSYGID